MADYSRQNFKNMKQEAVRTAKEMHQKTCENNNNNNSVKSDCQPVPAKSIENCGNSNGSLFGIADSILDRLGFGKGKLDNEKVVIIIMIIILAREGADLKLLLALGYILM